MKYSSLLVSLTCACFGLSARGATMTISSNPGQDVTVKLALPANNTEAVPVLDASVLSSSIGVAWSTVS